jgi:hypothetical protein
VTDHRGWPIISGIEYSSRSDALTNAQAAARALQIENGKPKVIENQKTL